MRHSTNIKYLYSYCNVQARNQPHFCGEGQRTKIWGPWLHVWFCMYVGWRINLLLLTRISLHSSYPIYFTRCSAVTEKPLGTVPQTSRMWSPKCLKLNYGILCHVSLGCGSLYYVCPSSGECIKLRFYCDGHCDCLPDCSDEDPQRCQVPGGENADTVRGQSVAESAVADSIPGLVFVIIWLLDGVSGQRHLNSRSKSKLFLPRDAL